MAHPSSRDGRRAVSKVKQARNMRLWCQRLGKNPQDLKDARARARAGAEHTPCSCAMCGNPRRWHKVRTRHEERAVLALQEGVNES